MRLPFLVDCQLSEYGDFGTCSVTCGVGIQTKKRNITVHPSYGGQACDDLSLDKNCTHGPCPGNYILFYFKYCKRTHD